MSERSRLFRIVRSGMSGVEQPTDKDLFNESRFIAIDLFLAADTETVKPVVRFNLENCIDVAGQCCADARRRVPGQRGKYLLELVFRNHAGAGLLHNCGQNEVG